MKPNYEKQKASDGILVNSVIGYEGDVIPEGYEEYEEEGEEDVKGNDFLPIGSGMDYYGTTAPEGYLFADGSAVSRTEYSALFEVIGITYGEGDGSTTFNLPDKREAVTIMKGANYTTLGQSVGGNTKKIAKENIPNYTLYKASHTHTFTGTAAKHTHGYTDYYATSSTASDFNRTYVNTGVSSVGNTSAWRTSGEASVTASGSNSSTEITVTSGGSGTDFNVMQKTLVCNYIIKAK